MGDQVENGDWCAASVFLRVSGSMAMRPPLVLFEHFEVSRIPETF